jgi:hypothetical protein
MTIAEANQLRDDYIKILVGKPYDGRRPDWAIKDVIVSDKENAANVYAKMYDGNMSNQMALALFSIKDDNYDTFIIAHQWPWGTGEMIIESVQNYLKANS